MRFVYPWTLALLWMPFILALAGWMRSRADPAWNPAFVANPMLAGLGTRPPRLQRLLQILLFSVGLALVITACARPQWGRREIPVITRNRHVMIVLDVSRSMLAADVHPNRLERARVDLLDLIGAFNGDRAGIIAFRRRPTLLCPLTSDVAFLRMTIDSLGTHSAPPGETDIGAALEAALDAFDTASPDHCAIVLISDGEDLGGHALEAARRAGKRGIAVFAVGIGSAAGSQIRLDEETLTHEDKPVVTRLEHETLAGIASESGGAYIPLATLGTANTTLGDIYRRHLDRIAAEENTESIEQRFVERYPWFLLPGLALILVCTLTSPGRTLPRRRMSARSPRAPALALAAAFLMQAAPERTWAGTPGDAIDPVVTNPAPRSISEAYRLVRQADELWQQGDPASAAQRYALAAEALPPERAALARWNSVLAYLRTNQLDRAEAGGNLLSGQAEFAVRALALKGELFRRRAVARLGDDPEEALRLLESATESAQEALLAASPDSEIRKLARDSLALSLEALPGMRREARIARALREAGQRNTADLLEKMLSEQRDLWRSAGEAREKTLPERIAAYEQAAEKQEHLRDMWYPVRQQVLASPGLSTNRSQRAEMQQAIEQAEQAMETSARALRDNAPDAVETTASPESILFGFWSASAPPPALIEQDILLQSNALHRLPPLPIETGRAQPAAAWLTERFQERFPEWADATTAAQAPLPPDSPAASETPADAPPVLDEETRALILQLAGETVAFQRKATAAMTAGTPAEEWQRQALERLLRIRELLPKQNQDSPDSPKNDSEEPEQEPQPRPPQDPPPEQPPQQPQERQESPEAQEPDPAEKIPRRIEDLMRMALERERERAEQKEREAQRIQPRTGIRDW